MNDINKQLVEQVQDAYAQNQALRIVGGDTKKHLCGRNIDGTELSVSGHTGVVSYDANELVLTARAGTTISELEAVLSENNQMLSFEPPKYNNKATLGGTLACNLSGAARPWSGSVRDLVLGVRLINGKGDLMRFGGQVMKNVAGYDVARLQAGAMGALGLISEISLKVLPKPQHSLTLVQECSQSEAIAKMNSLSGTPKPINGAAWHGGKLYLRLSGTENAVKGTASQWGGEELANAQDFWKSLNEQSHEFFKPIFSISEDEKRPNLWRFSIAPATDALFDEDAMLLDWSGAQRWLMGDYEFCKLQSLAAQSGGHVSLFAGGDRQSEVRQNLCDGTKQLEIGLKKAFDPAGILNPGRLYSWM